MPITIDKVEVCLDFHTFDILDFDLLLGYPLEKYFTSQGSLDEMLRESASDTAISCSENLLAKPFPEQNLLKMMVQTSSFSIESEPLPSSPHCVVLDLDRETTLIFHDEPLAIENRWARESSEALSL